MVKNGRGKNVRGILDRMGRRIGQGTEKYCFEIFCEITL